MGTMFAGHRTRTWRRAGAGALLLAVLLCAWASQTRAFTWSADLVVSAAFALVLVVAVAWHRLDRASPAVDRSSARSVRVVERRRSVGWAPWAATLALVVSWELYCVFQLPRADHPTLSSMLDSLDATAVGRGVCFGAWLALSWILVVA